MRHGVTCGGERRNGVKRRRIKYREHKGKRETRAQRKLGVICKLVQLKEEIGRWTSLFELRREC